MPPRKKQTERNVISRAVKAVQSQAMKIVGSQSPRGRTTEAIGSFDEDENTIIPTQTANQARGQFSSGNDTSAAGHQLHSPNKVLPVVPMIPLPREHRTRDDKNEKNRPPNWVQRTCVGQNCVKRQKSGRYLRKPGTADGDDQYLCFTCWSHEHVANANRMCFVCDRTHAGGCWYKSKLHEGKDLCTRCYERERRERLQSTGTMKCWCCGATRSSSKWRTSKDKSEGTKDLCNKCYLKECRATKYATVTGKSCCVCQTQITTEWKKSGLAAEGENSDICEQCFRREPGHASLEQ